MDIEIDSIDFEDALVAQNEILNPLTGLSIEIEDTDGLISAFEHLKFVESQCYSAKRQIAIALAAKTTGQAKTRRVEGEKRRAKIEFPDDSWDQSVLRTAWEQYPELRERCLKIVTISVQLREYKKLKETTGTDPVNQFRDAVVSANRGPTGTPRVTVEE